jgi:hypothetical protein
MPLLPLTFDDYPRLKPFFAVQRHCLCAYALPSVLAWTTHAYQPCGLIRDDTLMIGCEFFNDPANSHLLLPLTIDGSDIGPEMLARMAAKEGYHRYRFVTEDYLSAHDRAQVDAFFRVERQSIYDDYIYLTEDLAGLRGNRYAKKRNLIHQFQRDLVEKGRVAVEPIDSENVGECLTFLELWCADRNCQADQDEDLACEKQACINTLNHIDHIDSRGILVRVDGRVSAFGIASPLTAQMGTLQYEKAASDIKGLYQYLDNQCARQLFEGLAFINKESDMGLPGLAKAKQSYHPVMQIRSFTLELRT